MPRRSKGPRLWLQPARRDGNGTIIEKAVWVIRDGPTKRSTGCGPREIKRAEEALRDYLNAKPASRVRDRDPSTVAIADVVAIYTEDVVSNHARPNETTARLGRILDFFGDKTLAYLNKKTCADYVKKRGAKAAARRELEDLRAAVRDHWEAGLCTAQTPVVLPERGEARERWLTKQEAARFLRAARRMRQMQFGKQTDRATAQHVAQFFLVGLYTGTRAGAICGAALDQPTIGRSWINLETGIFYRQTIGRRKQKNKQQTPVRLPPRLLAHLRRWKRKGLSVRSVVEWNGAPVKRINKAFRSVRRAAGLGDDVVPHTLRHTCATWLAQRGVPTWEAAGYLGMTEKTFVKVYGHHHPDYQQNAVNAFGSPRQIPDRYNETKREHARSNVVKLAGKR
jgi:integrase